MDQFRQIQIDFLQRLKKSMPNPHDFVPLLSTLLHVQENAIYKRMRGESELGLFEYLILAYHFRIQINLWEMDDAIVFTRGTVKGNPKKVSAMIESIMNEIAQVPSIHQPFYRLASDDIPYFWHTLAPVILKFKIHYWTHAHDDEDKVVKTPFDPYSYAANFTPRIRTLREYWQGVSSEEITSMQPLNSILKQVQLYKQGGFLKTPDTIIELKKGMHQMLDEVEYCAIKGRKSADPNSGRFDLYVSEVNLGNQIILAESGQQESNRAYLSLNNYNYLKTDNLSFIKEHGDWFEAVKRKSFLYNHVPDSVRKRWFEEMRDKVEEV